MGDQKLINLKALVQYLEHQKVVVRRRTEYNLRKAKIVPTSLKVYVLR